MKMKLEPLEIRILGILKDWYPITVEELRDELSLPSGVLERALKSLMVKGIVQLEPLSDKTYIRLLTPEMVIEAGPHKKTVRKQPPSKVSDDSIMYH